MTCVLIAMLISCSGASIKTSPAEAAAIMAVHQTIILSPVPRGPYVVGVYSSPTAGPFGDFKPFTPTTRLDGTPRDVPQVVYGWQGPYSWGYSRDRSVGRTLTQAARRR